MFNENYKKIIFENEKWKIITSSIQDGLVCLDDPEHFAWFSKHTDSHPHHEVLFALEGTCHITLENSIYSCSPGTAVFFNSYEKHDIKYPNSSTGLTHLWLSIIEENIMATCIKVKNGNIIKVKNNIYLLKHSDLCRIFMKSWKSFYEGSVDPIRLQKLKSSLSLVLLALIEKSNDSKEVNSKLEYREEVVAKIQEYIKKTSGKDVTLTDLAKIAGYSKYHFIRLFQKYSGTSVHSYINDVRIEKVKQMKDAGYMKKEMADALGFSSSSSFSHWLNSF